MQMTRTAGAPESDECVTVYLDRNRTMIADLRRVRTLPNHQDPLGRPGEEFGAEVPAEMLDRWERVQAEFHAVLAEQDQVLAAIKARETPFIAAERAREAAEAEAVAAVRFGDPGWTVVHRRSRGGKVVTTRVHRMGCTALRGEPWASRLDQACRAVMEYGVGSHVYRYERTSAAPVFCSRCITREQAADIEAGVALGRAAGVDPETVAEWLAHGRIEQFRSLATLRALADGAAGELLVLPSGTPVR